MLQGKKNNIIHVHVQYTCKYTHINVYVAACVCLGIVLSHCCLSVDCTALYLSMHSFTHYAQVPE